MKKLIGIVLLVFAVAAASSLATLWILNRKGAVKEIKSPDWKAILRLTPEQEKKFASLESEFKITMNELETEDAQNKIFLCSYLGNGIKKPEIKSAAKKMSWVYEKKQEKMGAILASIAGILTAEQKRIFSQTLMHETCLSCRKKTGDEKCLCGMCDMRG